MSKKYTKSGPLVLSVLNDIRHDNNRSLLGESDEWYSKSLYYHDDMFTLEYEDMEIEWNNDGPVYPEAYQERVWKLIDPNGEEAASYPCCAYFERACPSREDRKSVWGHDPWDPVPKCWQKIFELFGVDAEKEWGPPVPPKPELPKPKAGGGFFVFTLDRTNEWKQGEEYESYDDAQVAAEEAAVLLEEDYLNDMPGWATAVASKDGNENGNRVPPRTFHGAEWTSDLIPETIEAG